MTGFEPLIGAAAAGLGGLITSLVKDKGTETLKKLDWDIGKNLALRKAMVDYVRRYIDRHGTLKVACVRMDYPVRLDEIYTAVQLLDRSALRYFESEDTLLEQYRESGRRSFNVTRAEKKPGLQVANEQQYLMVLGGPGVGKSTFLRKVGLEALRTLGRRDFAGRDSSNLLVPQGIFYQYPCIPVMLELRQFVKANISIKAAIAAELATCGFPEAEELTEILLKNGKLLVLLDGLDEVPSITLNHAITEIENLVDRYSENRYIASCRVAAYTFGGFRRFKDVAMTAFEDEQIQQFIRNWFQKERDTVANTADCCWQLLNSPDYQSAKELAQTPLLLTMLCVVYDEFQDFPKKRHALYGEALDVLLRKWAAEKRIESNPIYKELSAELELDMLAEIAYTSFVDDHLFFSRERVSQQIREFLVENLNAPTHLDAEAVLREVEIQQGILVERARGTYSFSHLTFQEYLAAKCIADNQKIKQTIHNHIFDKRWNEIFLLVAGIMPGSQGGNNFLLFIEQEIKESLLEEAKHLMRCSAQAIVNSSGNMAPIANQIAAIILLIGIHDHDSLFDNFLDFQIDNLADKYGLNYDKISYLKSRVWDLFEGIDLTSVFPVNRASYCESIFENATSVIEAYQSFGVFSADTINSLINSLEELRVTIPGAEIFGNFYKVNEEIQNFLISIEKCFLKIFGEQDKMSCCKDELIELKNHFQAVELMVRCKEAAVRVSPQVWEGIESRMVTVPD